MENSKTQGGKVAEVVKQTAPQVTLMNRFICGLATDNIEHECTKETSDFVNSEVINFFDSYTCNPVLVKDDLLLVCTGTPKQKDSVGKIWTDAAQRFKEKIAQTSTVLNRDQRSQIYCRTHECKLLPDTGQ